MTQHIQAIFLDLLYKKNLTKHKSNHSYFVRLIEDLQKKHIENDTGWICETFSSIGLINLDTDEKFIPLLSDIKDEVFTFAKEYGVYRSNLHCTGSWINLAKPGAFQEYHKHPKSHFSVVYYVKVPENSGDITFQSHAHSLEMFPLPIDTVLPASTGLFSHTPTEGELLIFRSNVNHLVKTNKSNENRVSISSNFFFQR